MTNKFGIPENTLRQIIEGCSCIEQTRQVTSSEWVTFTLPRYSAVAIMYALDKLEEQEKFMRWLANLVTHEDGEGAECEIICRRLYKMGYVEKHDTKDGKYWRATKVKEGWE